MDPAVLNYFLAGGQLPSPRPQDNHVMVMPNPLEQYMAMQAQAQYEHYRTLALSYFLQQNREAQFSAMGGVAPKVTSPPVGALASPVSLTMPSLPMTRLMLPTKLAEEDIPKNEPPRRSLIAAALSEQKPSVAETVPTAPTVERKASTSSPEVQIRIETPSTSENSEEVLDFFVDVESVDNRLEGKDRRKAHIEFYRKIKGIRQRDGSLQCAICDESIPGNDNSIVSHVGLHADAGGYRCRICGYEINEKSKIFDHIRIMHKMKMAPALFEDRRDMVKMGVCVLECFPRCGNRSKKEYVKEIERIISALVSKDQKYVECGLCKKQLPAVQREMLKHINQHHPIYKCKVCKHTTESAVTMEDHSSTVHNIEYPRNTVDYNVSSAHYVIIKMANSCFGHVIPESPQVFPISHVY